MSNIDYCIDSIDKYENEVVISGWAFSYSAKEIEISLYKVNNYEVSSVERVDLFHKYDENPNALKAGFSIKIHQPVNKVKLIFKDGKVEKVCSIRINENITIYKLKKKIIGVLHIIHPFNIVKIFRKLKKYGVKETIRSIKEHIFKEKLNFKNYNEWYRYKRKILQKQLNDQINYSFKYSPKISIVLPIYNTSGKRLKETVDSVINQTYSNWELCIVGCNSANEETKNTLREYEEKYENVKVKYVTSDEIISDNINEALSITSGEYIGLLDYDDLLTEDALFEVVKLLNENINIDFIYSDEDKINEDSNEYFAPHFKPDWSPDMLRSYNYICKFVVFSKRLLDQVGIFDRKFDGSQDYDMYLRLTEKARYIEHIPKILYHCREKNNSRATLDTLGKSYCMDLEKKALTNHLKRVGLDGSIEEGLFSGSYKVNYKIVGNPSVSIIIPNKDEVETLKKCIDSIREKSTYSNYEIIIVENNSETREIFEYYREIEIDDKIRVLKWSDGFNYSAINNFAVKESNGDYIILLNNDIEVVSPNWIEEMLMHSQRKEVGIVGAKLYYPDDTIQHAGVILGIGGVAGHSHTNFGKNEIGYAGRLKVIQNLSAVTAACLMVRREVYNEVNGLNEEFPVAFNDIDFCLKVRKAGYLIVFSPYVEAYHYESKSRGKDDTKEKAKRFEQEIILFNREWGLWLKDPYYNKNLTLEKEDFSLKP